MAIKKLLKYLLSFFRTILLFEAKNNKKKIFFKNIKIKTYYSSKEIRDTLVLRYLKEANRIERFKKKKNLVVLFYKKKATCLGWTYEGSSIYASEINKIINKKNCIFLFDYKTFPKFRNMGFYTKLLSLIINKTTNKIFLIYCLKSNNPSKKAILKAGFTLIKNLKRF